MDDDPDLLEAASTYAGTLPPGFYTGEGLREGWKEQVKKSFHGTDKDDPHGQSIMDSLRRACKTGKVDGMSYKRFQSGRLYKVGNNSAWPTIRKVRKIEKNKK